MGRQIDVDQLVGTAEIAERLGITNAEQVHAWRRRWPAGSKSPFPEPVAKLRIGYVWAWPDVEQWARETGRL